MKTFKGNSLLSHDSHETTGNSNVQKKRFGPSKLMFCLETAGCCFCSMVNQYRGWNKILNISPKENTI